MNDVHPFAFASDSDLIGRVERLPVERYLEGEGREVSRVVLFTAGRRQLHRAVKLAAKHDCPLDIYHDVPIGLSEDDAFELIKTQLFQAEYFGDVPEVIHTPVLRAEEKPWSHYDLFRMPLMTAHPNGGISDLRDAATFDGYRSGADCELHVDDDTEFESDDETAEPDLVCTRAMHAEDLAEVGPRIRKLRDQSIFEQLATLDPLILSNAYEEPHYEDPPAGGLKAVNPRKFPTKSCPTYDEDHIGSLRKLIQGARVAVVGRGGRQYEFPRCTQEWAEQQIVGTILCEAYSFACRTRNDLRDLEVWRYIIEARIAKTKIIDNSIDLVEIRARLSGTDPGIVWGEKPIAKTDARKLLAFYGRSFQQELDRVGEYVRFYGALERANTDFVDTLDNGLAVPKRMLWNKHTIAKRGLRRASVPAATSRTVSLGFRVVPYEAFPTAARLTLPPAQAISCSR